MKLFLNPEFECLVTDTHDERKVHVHDNTFSGIWATKEIAKPILSALPTRPILCK